MLVFRQVDEVVARFPEDVVPVLVAAATGSAASDFLRTEAFRMLGNILQRCLQDIFHYTLYHYSRSTISLVQLMNIKLY